ncbi:hypothetical protein PCE1_003449 [Barthelona sp. PCE]
MEHIISEQQGARVFKVGSRDRDGHSCSGWEPNFVSFATVSVVLIDEDIFIRLNDPESKELLAEAPVTHPINICVERVIDSSRFYVLRIVDRASSRHAYVGLGFADRSASFEFMATITDNLQHSKNLNKNNVELENQDFSLKSDSKISIGSFTGNPERKPAQKQSGGFMAPPPVSKRSRRRNVQRTVSEQPQATVPVEKPAVKSDDLLSFL